MKTTTKKVSMKGQPKAVAQANAIIAEIFREEGKPIRPILISGPSGVGKSYLIDQLLDGLESIGFESTIEIENTAEPFRTLEAFDDMILTRLSEVDKQVLVLDEAHALKGGNGLSSAAIRAFHNVLFPWGNKTPTSSTFALGKAENPEINWTNTVVIMATNNPEDLEQTSSKKKGETPFKRRCNAIDLSPYGDEIISEVIGDFLQAQGLRAADCSRNALARFHRQTLQAIADVVEAYKRLFPDKPTVSKDRMIEAAKITDWLPRGLNKFEGRLLQVLTASKGSVRKDSVASKVGCETAMVKGILAMLDGQQNNKGEYCPFVIVRGSVVHITESGERYIAAVLRDGFTL